MNNKRHLSVLLLVATTIVSALSNEGQAAVGPTGPISAAYPSADSTGRPLDSSAIASLQAQIDTLKVDIWQAEAGGMSGALLIASISLISGAGTVALVYDKDLAFFPGEEQRYRDIRTTSYGALGAGVLMGIIGLVSIPTKRDRAAYPVMMQRRQERKARALRKRENRRANRDRANGGG